MLLVAIAHINCICPFLVVQAVWSWFTQSNSAQFFDPIHGGRHQLVIAPEIVPQHQDGIDDGVQGWQGHGPTTHGCQGFVTKVDTAVQERDHQGRLGTPKVLNSSENVPNTETHLKEAREGAGQGGDGITKDCAPFCSGNYGGWPRCWYGLSGKENGCFQCQTKSLKSKRSYKISFGQDTIYPKANNRVTSQPMKWE